MLYLFSVYVLNWHIFYKISLIVHFEDTFIFENNTFLNKFTAGVIYPFIV